MSRGNKAFPNQSRRPVLGRESGAAHLHADGQPALQLRHEVRGLDGVEGAGRDEELVKASKMTTRVRGVPSHLDGVEGAGCDEEHVVRVDVSVLRAHLPGGGGGIGGGQEP